MDSKISRRALWEVYYPPFQGALDAGIWGKRVRLVGWCVSDRRELLEMGKMDRLDKMNFVPQFVSVGDFWAKPFPCRFGACGPVPWYRIVDELILTWPWHVDHKNRALGVDLWNHLCRLTTFASQVAGCLSTMCAYNLVNGDMAKTDCQMPPLKSFLFGVGAGGFYKLWQVCGETRNPETCKQHVTCRRLIETMTSQEFMPVQMKKLDSNMTLLSEWEERS